MEDGFNLHQDRPTLYMSTITKSVFSEREIDTILHQNTPRPRAVQRFDYCNHSSLICDTDVSTTLTILPLLPRMFSYNSTNKLRKMI